MNSPSPSHPLPIRSGGVWGVTRREGHCATGDKRPRPRRDHLHRGHCARTLWTKTRGPPSQALKMLSYRPLKCPLIGRETVGVSTAF